jgi:hypothetical protein
MRKLPSGFYADLALLRNKKGEQEYRRDEILPDVVALFHKHYTREDPAAALLRDWANSVLDTAEAVEDKAQDDLFPHQAQVALGGPGRPRIKRGRINLDQAFRRKRVIDTNKIAQDRSWANETHWLGNTIDALRGHAPNVVREDVLHEDGTPLRKTHTAA